MDVAYCMAILLVTLTFADAAQGICKTLGPRNTFRVSSEAIHPLGLQQCETKCLSDTLCNVMVYHVGNLDCYLEQENTDQSSSPAGSGFIVKNRTLLGNVQCGTTNCESGYSCVKLSSGVSVCMGGFCNSPPAIPNTIVNAGSHSISSTATYACLDDYSAIGNTVITCAPNLQWTTSSLVCTRCNDNFIYDAGTKMNYTVVTSAMTHSNALTHCANCGTQLVKINSIQRMHVFTGSFIFWTDLTDSAMEGTWVHSDGSVFDMSLFTGNEPNGGTLENCAFVWVRSGSNELYDANCNQKIFFICEHR